MSGYDFSPLYHASHLAFSPGSTFLAVSHDDRLMIRSTSNLGIIRTWRIASLSSRLLSSASTSKESVSTIDWVQWSDDGLYILVFCKAEGVALVFSLAQAGMGEDGEVARIDNGGVEGIDRVEWARGGREVLAWGEHGVR
jgi:WD40 repeat protein